MKWNEVFCHTFKVLKKEIEPAVKKQVDFQKKSRLSDKVGQRPSRM